MPYKMYFMTSPAVTIRSAVGLLLFISPVNAAFHPPRVIAAENIETEKYPPFREWRIPFFIKNYSTITCIILQNTIFFNNRMQV